MSVLEDLGRTDLPQIAAEPIRRETRALPSRRAGEIERQVKASQHSQQSSRAVEALSYEQDEWLRAQGQQCLPDLRAGSPEPDVPALERDSGSDSDSSSESDPKFRFEETETLPLVGKTTWCKVDEDEDEFQSLPSSASDSNGTSRKELGRRKMAPLPGWAVKPKLRAKREEMFRLQTQRPQLEFMQNGEQVPLDVRPHLQAQVAQVQWHPATERDAQVSQLPEQGYATPGPLPLQQDAGQQPPAIDALSILAAIAGEASRIPVGSSSHTTPTKISAYSTLAGALSTPRQPDHIGYVSTEEAQQNHSSQSETTSYQRRSARPDQFLEESSRDYDPDVTMASNLADIPCNVPQEKFGGASGQEAVEDSVVCQLRCWRTPDDEEGRLYWVAPSLSNDPANANLAPREFFSWAAQYGQCTSGYLELMAMELMALSAQVASQEGGNVNFSVTPPTHDQYPPQTENGHYAQEGQGQSLQETYQGLFPNGIAPAVTSNSIHMDESGDMTTTSEIAERLEGGAGEGASTSQHPYSEMSMDHMNVGGQQEHGAWTNDATIHEEEHAKAATQEDVDSMNQEAADTSSPLAGVAEQEGNLNGVLTGLLEVMRQTNPSSFEGLTIANALGCVPPSTHARVHTGLEMYTTESTAFSPEDSAAGHLPLDDLIEVDGIQRPNSPLLSPLEYLSSPLFRSPSSDAPSASVPLEQSVSRVDMSVPTDGKEQEQARVHEVPSVPGGADGIDAYASAPASLSPTVSRIEASHNPAKETSELHLDAGASIQSASDEDVAQVHTEPQVVHRGAGSANLSDGMANGNDRTSSLESSSEPESGSQRGPTPAVSFPIRSSPTDDASPCFPPSLASSSLTPACPTCGCMPASPPPRAQRLSAFTQPPVSGALTRLATPRSLPSATSPAGEKAHSFASHSKEDKSSTNPRASPAAVPGFQEDEDDSEVETGEASTRPATSSSPVRLPQPGRDFWEDAVVSLLGDVFQRMSIYDNEALPMPASEPAASTEPENRVVEVFSAPNLVTQNREGDIKSSFEKERNEVSKESTPVEEVANVHEVQRPTSSSEGAKLVSSLTSTTDMDSDSEAPSAITRTTRDSSDLPTPTSANSGNPTYGRTNNAAIAERVGSEPEGSPETQLWSPYGRKKLSTRKQVKRIQQARQNLRQAQKTEPTVLLPPPSVRSHAPVSVLVVISTVEEAIASIGLNQAEAQIITTANIAVPPVIVDTENSQIQGPGDPAATSLSAIRPQASLVVGAGRPLLSAVQTPLRERRVTFAAGSSPDQPHHDPDPPKPRKSTKRTSRSTAKRVDIDDKRAGAVARVEAPPAQSQTDDTGPRFRGLQSVEPAGSVGVLNSLPAAPPAQDISEDARMPGGADFGVEPRHTPCRPFASQEHWTPPSPPPSPPLRQNGYLRGAPVVKEEQRTDAVDEVRQAPVPESGGLVGFIINRCVRYLGFA